MCLPWIPYNALVALIAVVTLPTGILSAVFLGLEVAAVVFVVGWFLLVPVVAILGETAESGAETEADPIERALSEMRSEETPETERRSGGTNTGGDRAAERE